MQNVSEEWKAAHERLLVPESFVELEMNVGDPASQGDARASDNGSEYFANTPGIVDEVEKKPERYATLEDNIWLLNGKAKLLPDSMPDDEQGYIGNTLSGSDGTYFTTPTITISFSRVFEDLIPGIMIQWATAYEEYADTFIVTAYNGDTVIAQKQVVGNKDVLSIVELDIENYNKIAVEVLKWCLPKRRARIQQITIGIIKKYTKSELLNYSHSIFVDPISATLPKSEIAFEIVNLNDEYNPDNPRGAEKYLMERQMITARYGYKLNDKIEWIQAGTFFLSEWETPQNGISASFTARDMLEYMTDNYYGPVSGSLAEIATSAFSQTDIPLSNDGTSRLHLHSSLNDITVPDGVVLNSYTVSEVLQYCAHAACCVFYQDRAGILHIEPLSGDTADYSINRFNSFANSEIELTKQLKAISVNNGDYYLSVGKIGETQTVDNPLVSEERAPLIANWLADFLVNRKLLSGEFRADPRLDALDRITNINQFAETNVLVTEIQYTYNGAFRGTYEGRAGV